MPPPGSGIRRLEGIRHEREVRRYAPPAPSHLRPTPADAHLRAGRHLQPLRRPHWPRRGHRGDGPPDGPEDGAGRGYQSGAGPEAGGPAGAHLRAARDHGHLVPTGRAEGRWGLPHGYRAAEKAGQDPQSAGSGGWNEDSAGRCSQSGKRILPGAEPNRIYMS